ncbi:MAG: double zinc ribbon domain-containing protein [Candidatus Devosia symbiotica]|nr:double zinc ribbon domain-containing protein [Candidatus Devosia symbiotica]
MQSADELVKSGEWRRGLAAGARWLGHGLLDLVYPPVCLHCDAPTVTPDTLCPACFARLRPITAPLCPRLGLLFAVSLRAEALSAETLADPPSFGQARAAVIYNDMAGTIVSRLKYGD